MPQVGNQKFPYTPEGIARANQARRPRSGRIQQIQKVVGGQTNQRKPFGPGNQPRPIPVSVPLAPRPVRGTPPAPTDRMYRPEYGPKGPPMDRVKGPGIPINRRRTY